MNLPALEPTRDPSRAVLSLGSNLGDRLENLQQALDTLVEAPGIDAVAVSPVYETRPVGGPDQPDYLNVVVLVDTVMSPRTLLERAQAIEVALGRERLERWGPRVIDIDLVDVDGDVSQDDALTLPHPRAHERAFVLAPWQDVDAGASLPTHGTVTGLLAGVGLDGVSRRDDLVLELPG